MSSAASWAEVSPGSDFPLDNLPYGVFRRAGEGGRVGSRIGDTIVDLALLSQLGLFGDDLTAVGACFGEPTLNAFMAEGPQAWSAVRQRLRTLLERGSEAEEAVRRALVAVGEVEMLLPFEVGDYVDFYSSLEHATNLGRLFRPEGEPLLPNWRHLPVAYHGRSGTVVVSGTPVQRPCGQSRPSVQAAPSFGPSRRLDFELELGFVVGVASRLGRPVPVEQFREHVFGVVLVNDWSARDLQAWEYQPLGPFLGKSFATSVSAWVVPLEALEPHRVQGVEQEPPVLPYLRRAEEWSLDIELVVELNGAEVSRTNARGLYWDVAQQLAHATVNGASVRAGTSSRPARSRARSPARRAA